MRTKAVIPIGTIILIVIVLIAGFGIYWYFIQSQDDCSDVKHTCTGYLPDGTCGHHYYWIRAGTTDDVAIQWWENSGQWRVIAYVQANDKIETFMWFNDPDDLNDWFQAHYAFSDVQKVDTARMIECIKAGCPSCQEV